MKPYEITSKAYYSNCLIEAFKAKIKNRNVTIYFFRPGVTENGRFQFMHFMWSDSTGDYDFSDLGQAERKPIQCLLFKGVIRRFEPGFAEEYSRYRNGRRKTGGV